VNLSDLIVSQLAKAYPTAGGELVVFEGISFALARGESLAVTGPSGTGKSTLLHILGTLDRPTHGSVRLLGADPFVLDEKAQARFRRERIGFIFQDHQLMPQLNVLENTLLPALADGAPTAQHVSRARELLERVGLSDRLGHLPSELSGGEQARVAVARSLLLGPTLILADEPTGNLDPQNAGKIGQLLLELQRVEQTLLIVVTHSMELAATMQRQLPLVKAVVGV
jgi:lipoprotein-releasing system ATP-binding protein